jgi:uroporphyrinogen-III synthase
MPTTSKLADTKILVTRPNHQADHLCQLVEQAGGQAIRLPVIEIVAPYNFDTLYNYQYHLDSLDFAIFVSANAVEYTLPIILRNRSLPKHLKFAAIGKKTMECLLKWHLPVLCAPSPYNSEALLDLPELQQVKNKAIAIFRGEGGRELLADTLRKRGAIVDYVNVYQRACPATPTWINDIKVDVAVATSVEGLQNLFKMLKSCHWIKTLPLVLMSERMQESARKLGSTAPLFIAPYASDEGLLEAMLQWKETCLDSHHD